MSFAELTPERPAGIPEPFCAMRGLSLLSFMALLMLWSTPWVDLDIDGHTFATQSGCEVALGKVSYTGLEGYHHTGRACGYPFKFETGCEWTNGPFNPYPGIPRGLLAAGFVVLVLSGGTLALVMRPARSAVSAATVCSLLAAGVLARQLVLGFLIEPVWTAASLSVPLGTPGVLTVRCTPWIAITLAVAFLLPVAVLAERWVRQHDLKVRASRRFPAGI